MYICVDITYTGNKSFPYLLNAVSSNEKTLLYNAVARVLCNKQDGGAYATALREMFSFVTERFPNFQHERGLDVILVDFNEALGTDVAERVLRGCQVHWTRSLQRVCKLVTKSAWQKTTSS